MRTPNNMKSALIIILLTITQLAFADNAETLHQKHCVECHSRMTGGDGHVIYTRDDRITNNIDSLKERVAHCSDGSNTGWNEDEMNQVMQYLNSKHYNY